MKRRPHKIVSVVLLAVLIAGMGMACRIQSLESRNKRWAENTETAGKILTESGKKEAQKQTDGTENDAAAQNAFARCAEKVNTRKNLTLNRQAVGEVVSYCTMIAANDICSGKTDPFRNNGRIPAPVQYSFAG